MSVGNLREKYRTRASECDDSRERKNHAVRRRRGDSERSGIRNRWRRTRRERTTREKIVTQRDRTRGSSGFSRDVTAPAAGGRRLPTRTLVRFLGLIGCRPAPRLVHEESGPFSVTTPFPLFFLATLSRLAIKIASRRVPVPRRVSVGYTDRSVSTRRERERERKRGKKDARVEAKIVKIEETRKG